MSTNNCIRRMARHPHLRLTPVALAAMLLAPSAWPATRTWNGGAGIPHWDLSTNWNTGLPGTGDIAALGAFDTTINFGSWALKSLSGTGTLTMNSGLLSYEEASSLGGLVLNGGSLGGKGTLAVGNFTWAGGSLGNAGSLDGTVNVSGTTTLAGGAYRSLDYGQALNLNGNANWVGNGYLYLSGAGDSGGTAYRDSSLTLGAGKTLALQGSNDTSVFQIYGPGSFSNAGTVTKTGTNSLYIASKFNNTGTLNINAGETWFQGTQNLGGTINVASGATLHFSGDDLTFAAGAAVSGAGNFVFDGTSTVVASGTRTFGGAGTKTLAYGNLGGAGTVVFNRLAWTGGTMGYYNAVGGTTTVNGATTLGGGYLDLAFGRKLNLNGDVTWVGSGTLNISGAGSYGGVDYAGSVLNLAAGRTFSLQGSTDASTFNIYGSDTSAVNNAGTITKTGSNNLQIFGKFNNTGTLNVNGGQTWLYTSNALGGTVNVAAGAGLHFGGDTTFDPTMTISGDGNLLFENAATLASGTLNFGGAGTKTLTGYLGGAGTMVFNNLTWAGGYVGYYGAPGGTTTVNGTTTIAGLYPTVAYGRTLNLNGDVNWAVGAGQPGQFAIQGAGSYGGVDYVASIVNLAAGKTLNLQGGSDPGGYFYIGGGGTFNNAGTITKTGANQLQIGDTFNNTGTLNINGGQAYLYNNGTLGGTVNVVSASGLHFAGSTTIAPTAVIAGNGSLYFDGSTIVASGTRTFGGSGNKTLTTGSLGGAGTMTFNKLTWAGGSMGDYTAPGGTTTVTGLTTITATGAYVNYGRTVNLNGGANWAGAGQIVLYGAGDSGYGPYGASVVKLASGKTLALQGSNDDSALAFLGGGTFINAGTVTKTGSNNLVIGSNFTNSGTLSIGSSPAQISSALFSNTGTVTISGGLTQFYGGTLTNAGSLVAAGGVVQIQGGTFSNTGTLHANGGRIEVTGYTLAQWNPTSQTLTNGTYRVTGSQPIAFDLGYVPSTGKQAVIKTNRAKIYLDGAGAALVSTLPEPDVSALKSLASNYGVLSLTGGAAQAITGSLKNRGTGTIVVGEGSALTLGGGTAVFNQIDTAATFVGGTLSAKTITLDAGSLSAGLGAGLIGNGTVSASVGGLTFGAAARLDEDVGTAAWDRLTVASGNVTVDGTLNATFASGAGVGTYRFLTASAGQVLGTFDAITSNLSVAQFSVQAVYGANYVDLQVSAVPTLGTHPPSPTAVPEPQSAALLAAGLAGLGWWARRRQRGDGRARA